METKIFAPQHSPELIAKKSALEYIQARTYQSVAGSLAILLLFTVLYFDAIPTDVIVLNLTLFIAVFIARILYMNHFNRVRDNLFGKAEIALHTNLLVLSLFATALVWVVALFSYTPYLENQVQLFVVVMVVGLFGVSVGITGVLLVVYLAFALPLAIGLLVWMFIHPTMHFGLEIGIVGIGILYLIVGARNFGRSYQENIIKQELATASQLEVIYRLSRAAEFRDNETGMHIVRMSHYAYLLALKAGLSEKEAQEIEQAAKMHDIGKIGIPDYVLLKPGKLSDEEFVIMKTHASIGGDILCQSNNTFLELSHVISLTHHEKYDGSGYPMGLKGDAIPLAGQIVAVCDVFDALVSHRPYKRAWSIEETFEYIIAQSGSHFNPQVVKWFVELKPEITAYAQAHQDHKENP